MLIYTKFGGVLVSMLGYLTYLCEPAQPNSGPLTDAMIVLSPKFLLPTSGYTRKRWEVKTGEILS